MTWVTPADRCCDTACAIWAGEANPPWGQATGYFLILAVGVRHERPPREVTSARSDWANFVRSSADAWPAALLPIGPARSRTAKLSSTVLSVTPRAPFGVARHGPPVAADGARPPLASP